MRRTTVTTTLRRHNRMMFLLLMFYRQTFILPFLYLDWYIAIVYSDCVAIDLYSCMGNVAKKPTFTSISSRRPGCCVFCMFALLLQV